MSSRPPVFTWNEELHFGPPSEPINIQAFVDQAQNLDSRGRSPWLDFRCAETGDVDIRSVITGWQEWQALPEDARSSIEQDCNLDDMKDNLLATFMSQARMSYVRNASSVVASGLIVQPKRKRNEHKAKHKAKRKNLAEEHSEAEFESFKKSVEQTPLKMWKLKPAAQPFVRSGHVSDQNALHTLQLTDTQLDDNPLPLSHEVIVTLTAYTRNTWYPYAFSRDSQHVLPSNDTLADVWACIPCAFKGDGSMPKDITELDLQDDSFGHHGVPTKRKVVGFSLDDNASDRDSVSMVVEGIAYSDGRTQPDYADNLLFHLDMFKAPPPDPDAPPPLPPGPYERPKSSTPLKKGPSISTVPLRSLTLRINEPYWILHRGNCEHWFVIDEIRLQNPHDPTTGYPIGLQRTPVFPPLCRICAKVPATLSVLNDARLGESPGMVCQPCWMLFGGPPQPKEGDDADAQVVVVPMVLSTS